MEKISKHIIFVGGVHGVGKTSTCSKICDELGLVFLQASRLIYSDEAGKTLNNKFHTAKDVNNIKWNQIKLINSLDQFHELDKWYLLDGHLTLINSAFEVEHIPLEVFEKIKPDSLIILKDDASNISKKLKSRDGIHYEINFLERMQSIEIEHAQRISRALDIVLFIIDVNNVREIRNAILTVMSR